MSAQDRAVGAAALKRLRLARGWSLADIARAIVRKAAALGQPLDASVASVQRSVARWESGRTPILPGERYQLLLAHLYARGTEGHTSLGTHLRGFEGVTSLYVGDPAEAHDYFASSAGALQAPRERVQRAIVATDQALARLRLDEPESAAELLHGCIDAAAATGGRVAAIRLRRARSDLRPWRREHWFAALDDHLLDSLGA